MRHEEFKSKKYDEISELLDNWTKYINPCNVKNENGFVTCVNYPNGSSNNLLCCAKTEQVSKNNLFNSNCKHHDCNKGCTVNSLSCKQWFCEKAWDNMFEKNSHADLKEFMQILEWASQESRLHFIPSRPRQSKEENFDYANLIFK